MDAELREKLKTFVDAGYHACYCPRSVDNGCECAIKDEYVDKVVGFVQQEIAKAKAVNIGNAHELLMAYGKACEEEGCLSERAVTIRMDLATYYNDQQLETLKEHKEA